LNQKKKKLKMSQINDLSEIAGLKNRSRKKDKKNK
jgi:hypothetical protein